MRRSFLLAPVLLAAGLSAGCQDPAGTRASTTYVLVELDGQPLPAPLDRSTARSLDVLDGTLTLEPRTWRGGRVHSTGRILWREADGQTREELSEATGRYERDADRIHLRFDNGSTHSLQVEAGGARLRTIGTTCAGFCVDVLRIAVYQRQ